MNWKFYNPKFKYEKMYDDLGGPWAGHKYFAYDLIRNLKPKKIVELGTHLGCSLFSFAQAVQDGKLDTQLDAIDTWEGDEHSGEYGRLILLRVKEIQKLCYSKIKMNLLRKTFDEANREFKDNSIDLLHIDGLHTYKIIKHDFENWFNKVKENGIILLHDTAVKQWGFGVYKLLAEIQKDFRIIHFDHSYGLGVVFKDSKIYEKIRSISVGFPLYYSLKADKEQLEWDFNKQREKLDEYKKQLTKIKKSRPYKLWQIYRKIKKLLF